MFKGIAFLIIIIFFQTSCGLPPPGTALTPEERESAKKKCIAQHVIVGAAGSAFLNTFPVAGYQETAKIEGYNPNEGNVVKIKSFSSSPKEVRAGGKVQLNGSYYVMAPEDIKDAKVKETRIYYYYDTTKKEWVELGPVENEVTPLLALERLMEA